MTDNNAAGRGNSRGFQPKPHKPNPSNHPNPNPNPNPNPEREGGYRPPPVTDNISKPPKII